LWHKSLFFREFWLIEELKKALLAQNGPFWGQNPSVRAKIILSLNGHSPQRHNSLNNFAYKIPKK
jgi:hypothetical protein